MAYILCKPATAAVLECLNNYVELFRVPNGIRSYPVLPFRSHKFRQFCSEGFIELIECPVEDQRRNGKIERCTCTIFEHQRTIKGFVFSKDKTGLS